MDLPVKKCKINTYFVDANDPNYERLRYCRENCKYKCFKKDYKHSKIKLNMEELKKLEKEFKNRKINWNLLNRKFRLLTGEDALNNEDMNNFARMIFNMNKISFQIRKSQPLKNWINNWNLNYELINKPEG